MFLRHKRGVPDRNREKSLHKIPIPPDTRRFHPRPEQKDTYTASRSDTDHTPHCTCPGQYTDARPHTSYYPYTPASHNSPNHWPHTRSDTCKPNSPHSSHTTHSASPHSNSTSQPNTPHPKNIPALHTTRLHWRPAPKDTYTPCSPHNSHKSPPNTASPHRKSSMYTNMNTSSHCPSENNSAQKKHTGWDGRRQDTRRLHPPPPETNTYSPWPPPHS